MPDIVIVGEAWGEYEEQQCMPFVGPAGWELDRWLAQVGINRGDCLLTNVLNKRPPSNKIEAFCGPKAEGIPGYPSLTKGYLRKEFVNELDRLGDEILAANPNIIIALGNTPMWALLGRTAITKFRGTTDVSTHTVTGYKVLPTLHPSYIMRGNIDQRPIVISDLMKAKRESTYPEIRRPKRIIYVAETLEDIQLFRSNEISGSKSLIADIETSGTQITCIGFSPRPEVALVIPIIDPRRANRSYWPDTGTECQVWRIIRRILADETIRKIFQNGMYDIAFLYRSYGIKVFNAGDDPMLLHHALQPESLKGLGFLGSIYCDEGPWKQMNKHRTTIKRDA